MNKLKLQLIFIISIFIVNMFAQTPYEVSVRFINTTTGLDYTDVSSIQFEIELDPPSGDIQVGPSSFCHVNIADIGAGVPHSFIQFDLVNFTNIYTPTSILRIKVWDSLNPDGFGEILVQKDIDIDPAGGNLGWGEFFGGLGGDPIQVEPDSNSPSVVLSDFATAVFENEFVQINWTTQSASNLNLWNLYRDNVIIHTEAAVNGTEPHEYIYEDTYVTVGETYTYYLEAVDNDGTTTMFGPVSATMTGAEIPELPTETKLKGIYPNPFN